MKTLVATSTLICLAFAISDGKLAITSSPIIDPEQPLVISCSYTPDEGSATSNLISLTLSKRNGSAEHVLISANAFHPNHVEQSLYFFGASHALIQNGSDKSKKSYLTAEYLSPTEEEAGEYICTSRGLDRLSESIKENASMNIEIRPEASSDVTPPGDTNDNSTNCHKAIRDFAKQATAAEPDVIGVSDIFNETSFYIIVSDKSNFDQAEKICGRYSSNFAEINTEQEFLFLKKTFKELGIFQSVTGNGRISFLTGARFLTLSSPFEFYTHRNDDVYTGHWDIGEPHRNNLNFNWLLLVLLQSEELKMADGRNNHENLGYLCEVSFQHM